MRAPVELASAPGNLPPSPLLGLRACRIWGGVKGGHLPPRHLPPPSTCLLVSPQSFVSTTNFLAGRKSCELGLLIIQTSPTPSPFTPLLNRWPWEKVVMQVWGEGQVRLLIPRMLNAEGQDVWNLSLDICASFGWREQCCAVFGFF